MDKVNKRSTKLFEEKYQYDLKNSFSINDFALALYCPNVFIDSDRYISLQNKLVSFDKYERVNTNNYEMYASYLSYMILMNSLELDKSINSYESYYFSVLTTYCMQNNLESQASNIAKRWIEFVKAFGSIVEIIKQNQYSNICIDHLAHNRFKHINSDVFYSSYHWTIPIVLEKDSDIDIVILLPQFSKTFWVSNIYILSCIQYISNLRNIYLYSLDIFTGNISYTLITPSQELKIQCNKLLERQVIDFTAPVISNCSTCPISEKCSKTNILKGVIPNHYLQSINTSRQRN